MQLPQVLDGLGNTVHSYRDKLGIPHIQALTQWDAFMAQGYVTAQDLRKFFGSWHLGVNKTDIMTVSKWMGHRDPKVTFSTYAKVIEELEKEQQYDIGNALVTSA